MVTPGGERIVVPPALLIPELAPFTVTTDDLGHYSFAGVPTVLEDVQVRVSAMSNGQTVSAASGAIGALSSTAVVIGDITLPIQQNPQREQQRQPQQHQQQRRRK